MLATEYTKVTIAPNASLDVVPADVFSYGIAGALEANEIALLRVVSKALQVLSSSDEIWLNKLTVLALQVPAMSFMDQGDGESALAWYARCALSVGSCHDLAARHVRGEFPFLELYGKVEGSSFTPYSHLRFPIEQGAIVELIKLKARQGCRDPPHDASLAFYNPSGVAIDGTFRHIQKVVIAATRAVRGGNLKEVPTLLSKMYEPRARAESRDALISSCEAPATAAAAPPFSEGAAAGAAPKALSLRLKRMSTQLVRANARIAELEAEVAHLRGENSALRAENRELKAENARLTGSKRRLKSELESAQGELRELHAEQRQQTISAREQLTEQRQQRAALQRKADGLLAERDRLQQLLLAAERAFNKASAALERERGRVDAARDKEGAARLRAAQAERDAAAEVAAAQRSASETIEAELHTRIQERGLMTMQQFVDFSTLEAAVGMTSPGFLSVAANVMSTKCPEASETVTLPSTSASGKGRGGTYMRVVNAIKPSDKLTKRGLWERTQQLKASLNQISGGDGDASIAQLAHFLQSQKELVAAALEGTWLSPPKKLDLEACVSMRSEMSGAMYDAVISFIKEKTGVKTDATRKEIKAAFDDFSFEYETGKFTSVDDKEVDGKDGKKTIKRVTTNGYYLRVKDPLAVLQQSAAVHAKEGRLAWPSCVPHDVYPVCVMLDAGGGSTKVVLKHPCIMRADSVRSITLLAVMTGAKDTYAAMKEAFGPLLKACSDWNRRHTELHLPWAPRLPVDEEFELCGEAKLPTKKVA